MKSVKVFDKTFVPYIEHDELMELIDTVADQINEDYKDEVDVPIVLCVLNGAIMFTSEILKRLNFPLELMSVKIKSYVGDKSTGVMQEAMGLTGRVEGRRVIIVEDIVDTGNTMVFLKDLLAKKGAKDSRICTMLFKPDAFVQDIKIDYIAKSIPNKFILGFGLDYNELGRNLRDIYILDK